MQCLRCGYCCKHLSVVIVDDPNLGIVEGNLIFHNGQGNPCPHLIENENNICSCSLHNEKWYEETPCFEYTQVEKNINVECRMGRYILDHRSPDL